MSAAGRAYGVICADRGGGRFELSDGERHLLWTLGKTAALVATARNATRQQERTRRLGERLDLAREIHERVLQRLFGVSLALSAEAPLDRRRARALPGRDAGGAQRPAPGARAAAGAAAARDRDDAGGRARAVQQRPGAAGLGATGRPTSCVPARSRAARPVGAGRGAAQRRQARRPVAGRRCRRPRRGHVQRSRCATTASGRGRRGAGMGLRLAAFEALQHGGVVEFGARGPTAGASGWSCRSAVRRACGRWPDRERVGRRVRRLPIASCACSSSTITTSCTGASGSCSASSRGSSAASPPGPAPRRSS